MQTLILLGLFMHHCRYIICMFIIKCIRRMHHIHIEKLLKSLWAEQLCNCTALHLVCFIASSIHKLSALSPCICCCHIQSYPSYIVSGSSSLVVLALPQQEVAVRPAQIQHCPLLIVVSQPRQIPPCIQSCTEAWYRQPLQVN